MILFCISALVILAVARSSFIQCLSCAKCVGSYCMVKTSRWHTNRHLRGLSCLGMEMQTPAHAEGAWAAGNTSLPLLLLSRWETLLGGDFAVFSLAAVHAPGLSQSPHCCASMTSVRMWF